MKFLTLVFLLFSSFSFACSTNENTHELPAFAEFNSELGDFDIYADKVVFDADGREAKIETIELFIKDMFHLRLRVEDGEYYYNGYFVASGVLNESLAKETLVIIKYNYGDLTMCGPMRHHKLSELFNINKPAKVVHPVPPIPKPPSG